MKIQNQMLCFIFGRSPSTCPGVFRGFRHSLQADVDTVLHIMRQEAFCPGFIVYLTMIFQLCVRMFVNDRLEGPGC
jgi:hypothetical protein